MSAAGRERLKEIFHAAAELAGAERGAFLERACEGDDALRREIESLLAHDHEDDDEFSETSMGIGRGLIARAVSDGGAAASIPERVGRYRILEKIGEGGMGSVYLAEQDHPNRRVALKMIRPEMMSPNLLRRFRHEEDLLGRLQHPGIAQIYEAGEIDAEGVRQPYFAMEHVDGVELRGYARQHDLDTRQRLELVARIADAISHAHQKGIIHRDLKPDNILVVDEPATTSAATPSSSVSIGQPKVLDFGVARATDCDVQITTLQTEVGQLIGTVPYMSPEQVAGDSRRLDTRSDIYALGVILYELLSGCLPFDLTGKSIPEAARMIRDDEPKRLGSIRPVFRGDIETIVTKALEKDPGRRYQSAAEFAVDIRHYLADEPIAAHPPSTFYQLGKFARRNKGLVAGLALTFVVLVSGVVSSLILAGRAMRGEAAARWTSYRLSITAAEAVSNTDPTQALGHLQAAPPEFRGWEWRHLNARLHSHAATMTGGPTRAFASTIASRADGTLLSALERDGAIELIDLESGGAHAVFREPGGLTIPNLSPDGSRLAAVLPDEARLVVWDVVARKRMLELPSDSVDAGQTRFSADGSLIALMSREEGMVVRETATGRIRFQTASPPLYSDIMAFGPEGRRIAVAHHEPGGNFTLRVFSATGEPLAARDLTDGCVSLAFSPDGARVAVGHEQRMVQVLEASTLETIEVLHGHTGRVTALAFSWDGAYLASSSFDGTTRIWNLPRGEILRVLPSGGATSIAFAHDDAVLAAGSSGEARTWEWRADSHRVLRGHQTYVYRAAFSPDGDLIASAEFGDRILLWDALTGEMLREIRAIRPDRALGFTPDGTRIVAFDFPQPQHLSAWDTAAGVRLTTPRTESDRMLFETLGGADGDCWLRYGRLTAGRGNRVVAGVGADTAFASNRSLIALGTHTGEICIVDALTGRTVRNVGNHEGTVIAAAFSPDGTRLVSGGEDKTVRIWAINNGAELATLNGHLGSVYSVNYSPDGRRIVSGGNDETIRIWDAERFEEVAVLRGHESYVHSVSFSPDGTMLASGSGDGTVRIWDSVPAAERGRQIREAGSLRREAEPLVDRLLDELGDPLEVAERLRGDESLDEPRRRAALQVLLRRSRPSD